MQLLSFLMKHSRRVVILACVAGAVSGAANTGLLALINTTLNAEDPLLPTLFWGFIALCIVVPLTRVVSELMLIHLGQGTIFDLRMEMSRRILAVPMRHLEKLGPHKLMATLTGDIPSITGAVTLLPILSINMAILVGCLIYLGYLSWQVLLAVLFFIIVGILSYQLPVARAMKYFEAARDERDDLHDHFRALTEGTKELKLHFRRRNEFLSTVLRRTALGFKRANVTGMKIYTIASSWGQLLVFVVIGLLLYGLPRMPIEAPSFKVLTGYVIVLLYLMTPLQMLMNNLPDLSQAGVSLRRVDEMGLELDEHATEDWREDPGEGGRWSRLELSGTSFVYEPREGEEGHEFGVGPFDLTIEPGELLFITGGNGSGKTTLAKLLIGLYLPDEGELIFDGEPVTEENVERYRQHFSVVFNDYYLFDSLLGLGDTGASELDEKAHGYLQNLELDEKVEVEDGRLSTTELSAGQRKRLALLTAYLEDRPIYLFDEWAADQDPVFKELFYRQMLPELRKRNKTVIVISHDDRYYEVADRLIKMEQGNIVLDTSQPSMASASA